MDLLSFEEAFNIVIGSASFTGSESVYFTDSFNRILAEEIKSDMDMPPFDKSTVDGFACRRADLGYELEIVEIIAAGAQPQKRISEKQCSRIMTGAVVPEGADMVFMVEDSRFSSGKVKYTGSFTKNNISTRGEDIKNNDTVLMPGMLIKPQDVALIASCGYTSVKVAGMPRVGVISSGDELVEPGRKPGMSQIRNSNSYQLLAQVKRAGAIGVDYGIVGDDENETLKVVIRAIEENDIVLITGGVSMGEFDFVPAVLEMAGVKIIFSKINVQPGKPTTFGLHPKSIVFGLPGNPVSSFVQFELLVRPLILKMMGSEFKPIIFSLAMKNAFSRKNADRMAFIPVAITQPGFVEPVEYHGSAHLSALSQADGFINLPVGRKSIEKGEMVSVRQI